MRVFLNEISGIPDAIVSMFMSKRTWTRELEEEVRYICDEALLKNGTINKEAKKESLDKLDKWLNTLVKWGWKHITMLKFIDLSFTVEGLHRAGQDDWDSHAKRFDNRIIRSSTRLARFGNEISDWYKDKIIPTDIALEKLGIDLPETIEVNGEIYIKRINGYIKQGIENNPDVQRGLYMLSIPSNFIYKINLTEFSHVYKERNANSGANPEVKECCEKSVEALISAYPQFNRDFLNKILN